MTAGRPVSRRKDLRLCELTTLSAGGAMDEIQLDDLILVAIVPTPKDLEIVRLLRLVPHPARQRPQGDLGRLAGLLPDGGFRRRALVGQDLCPGARV
jgi:hypothetical protein